MYVPSMSAKHSLEYVMPLQPHTGLNIRLHIRSGSTLSGSKQWRVGSTEGWCVGVTAASTASDTSRACTTTIKVIMLITKFQ